MSTPYPTSAMLAPSLLPALTGAEAAAERLLLITHAGAERDVWGNNPARYWDGFTERVISACIASRGSLQVWWSHLVGTFCTRPTDAAARRELALLLTGGHDKAVLDVLRQQTAALIMRVRVIDETTACVTDDPQAG